MKKIGLLVGTIIVLVGGYFAYTMMTEDEFYTKISVVGEKETKTTDRGETFVDYAYKLRSYNKAGEEDILSFYGNKEVPLKENAYLKLKVKAYGRVMSWEEVPKSEVPQKALKKLNQE